MIGYGPVAVARQVLFGRAVYVDTPPRGGVSGRRENADLCRWPARTGLSATPVWGAVVPGVSNAHASNAKDPIVDAESLIGRLLLAADAGAQGQPGGGLLLWLPFIIIGVLFYVLLIRPHRQEQTRREAMLAAVKKNDRVVTVGGIYGVVTNVRREADEVTIKVDEGTNTKLRMTLGSIARVIGEETDQEDTSSKKS